MNPSHAKQLRRLLIKQQLEGKLSAGEQRRLNEWLAADKDAARTAAGYAAFAPMLKQMHTPELSAGFADRLMQRLPEAGSSERRPRRTVLDSGSFRFAAAAACLLPLLTVSVLAVSGLLPAGNRDMRARVSVTSFRTEHRTEEVRKVPLHPKHRATAAKSAGSMRQLMKSSRPQKTADERSTVSIEKKSAPQASLNLKRDDETVRKKSSPQRGLADLPDSASPAAAAGADPPVQLKEEKLKINEKRALRPGNAVQALQAQSAIRVEPKDKIAQTRSVPRADQPAYRTVRVYRKKTAELPVFRLQPLPSAAKPLRADLIILLCSELLIRLLLLVDMRRSGFWLRSAGILFGSLLLPWWLFRKYRLAGSSRND